MNFPPLEGSVRSIGTISPYSPYFQVRDEDDYFTVEPRNQDVNEVVHLDWQEEAYKDTIDTDDESSNDTLRPSFRAMDLEEQKISADDMIEMKCEKVFKSNQGSPLALTFIIISSTLISLLVLVSYWILIVHFFLTDQRIYLVVSIIIVLSAMIAAATFDMTQQFGSSLYVPSFPLRHAITTVFAVSLIWRHGPSEFFSLRAFGHSLRTQLSFLKLGHVIFEAVPQLILLSYILMEHQIEFKNNAQKVLLFSITITLISIVTTLVQAYFRWEPYVAKITIGLFYFFSIIARIGAIGAIFLEFKIWAFIYMVLIAASRFFMLCYFHIFTFRDVKLSSYIGCVIATFILMIIPIGSDIDSSSLQILNQKYRGLKLAFGFTGENILTFKKNLANDFAHVCLLLTGAETLSMILIAALCGSLKPTFSKDSQSGHILLLCWFLLAALAIAHFFYFLSYWYVIKQEKIWKRYVNQALSALTHNGANVLLESIIRPRSQWNSIFVKQDRNKTVLVYLPNLLYYCYKTHRGPVYDYYFDDIDMLLAEIDLGYPWGVENIDRLNQLKPGGLNLTLANTITRNDLSQVRDVIFRAIEDDNVRPMLRQALKDLGLNLKASSNKTTNEVL